MVFARVVSCGCAAARGPGFRTDEFGSRGGGLVDGVQAFSGAQAVHIFPADPRGMGGPWCGSMRHPMLRCIGP